MESFGIRDLQRRSSEIVEQVEKSGRPALVTRYGKLAAILMPIDSEAFEDYILTNAPEFVASREDAEEDLREDRTRPAHEVFAEIEGEEGAARAQAS
ncbi:MAG: type II toxin-antitoxin system prevent-host-death family antitoxin [Thermoleophilaceae bacterium]